MTPMPKVLKRGFTLIEVMLSLVLVIALLSMAFALMGGMLKLGDQLSQETQYWIAAGQNEKFLNQGFEQLPNQASILLYQDKSVTSIAGIKQLLVVQSEQSPWALNEASRRAKTTLFEIRQAADGSFNLWLSFYQEALPINAQNMNAILEVLENYKESKILEFPIIAQAYELNWAASYIATQGGLARESQIEFLPEYLNSAEKPALLSLIAQMAIDQESLQWLFPVN